MARIAMNAFTPEQLAAQRIAEMQRLERDRANRQLPPGLYREFTGREEFEARGPGKAGPPLPQVPGDVAGPGAEEQITDEQVAQFLGRMPYRNAGRGPGEALEGVRIQDPRRMPREAAPPAREKSPPTVKATKPNPETDRFGEAVPMDRALAAEQADREKTRGQMDEMIAARRAGEDAARAKGFQSQQQQQQAGLEKQKGGRDILRDQWVSRMHARYGGLRDSDGNQMPRAFFENMYDTASQGGKLTHRETVMNAAGGLKDLKVHGGKGVRYQSPQQHAANVRANQIADARRFGVPVQDVIIAQGYAGAQTPFDLARHGLASEAIRPNRGHGNAGVAIGIEDTNARAVQGLGNGNQSPMQRLGGDQKLADSAPIEERAQAYRLQHRALNAGQPENPQAENLHLVNAGAQSASAAAASVLSGEGGEDEMTFLRDYTFAFTSGGESTNRAAFNKWARRLGIPVTEESMALWFKLTGTSPRNYNEAVGDFFQFEPGGWGNYFFPNVPSSEGQKPAQKPAEAKPAAKPKPAAANRGPRNTPRRPLKDD